MPLDQRFSLGPARHAVAGQDSLLQDRMERFDMKRIVNVGPLFAAAFLLAACGGSSDEVSDSEAEVQPDSTSVAVSFPESLAPFGDGYPAAGDPCRRLGESAATIDWLDDSATLVGCPSAQTASSLGGTLVGEVEGITVISIPSGNANEGMPEAAPAPAATSAPGPSATKPASTKPAAAKPAANSQASLEAKCKSEVERTTGSTVTRTVSSEFSEAGTMFRFEVSGAEAPWQCIGYSNGTVAGVMYTGSEGEL